MRPLPSFPVTTVGSWPRTRELLVAQNHVRHGRMAREVFDRQADAAVERLVRLQEEIGLDLVTDGEQRRDNFVSFVARHLEGVRLLSLADILEIIEDKVAFERILQTLDVPSYAIFNATCVGPLRRRSALVADDVRFVRARTDRPIKATLPGPYILTRSLFVKEATRPHYDAKEDLGDDVVAVLREEVEAVIAAGADFLQFDEPVLTELVFAQGRTRTFMCAALAARNDPAEELEFAVDLMNRVTAGVEGIRLGVHVCRGNWSRDERTLLAGSYKPLQPYLERMHVDQLVLEYATERAGAWMPFAGKELGLGIVNPRTEEVEDVAALVERIAAVARHIPGDRLFLNPDCGFGTFASRPMNGEATAIAKLRALVEAAARLRAGAAQ